MFNDDNFPERGENMEKKKRIPIGIEDFKTLLERSCYYVDKTLMIREILDSGAAVNLITRPRRFGKTLNLSMLRYFFERSETDHTSLFHGLAISQCDESYLSHMGKYPVISLTLKGIEYADYDAAYIALKNTLRAEFERHADLLNESQISDLKMKQVMDIYNDTADYPTICNALKLLSDCLYEATGEKAIILIDEYDVPLQFAYSHGYYEKMVNTIRLLFSNSLKTNQSMNFAVLTGCMRISKESIFTGLNNLNLNSIRAVKFSESFGFTDSEVQKLAEYYDLADRFPKIKEWYDGYRFGISDIYNPWSVLKYLDDCCSMPDMEPESYWSNTSSNSIVREIIENSDAAIRKDLETLISGKSITKRLYESITYADMNYKSDIIWSFLLHTGYLKPTRYFLNGVTQMAELVIPNKEVLAIYSDTIISWFDNKIKSAGTSDLFQAVIQGDADKFEYEVRRWLHESISYYDTKENYYHGFLTGLLVGNDDRYTVESNREAGNGRSDIQIYDSLSKQIAVIIEVKPAANEDALDSMAEKALKQIDVQQYAEPFMRRKYQQIIRYGAAFFGKECRIKMKACDASDSK